MQTIGRLAPSPTGAQHLGNARTFLIAWLSVRSQGGRLLLRVEDIDSPRVKAGADQQALDDLAWLGLDWDDGPIWQTQRLPLYEAALEQHRLALDVQLGRQLVVDTLEWFSFDGLRVQAHAPFGLTSK